MDDWAAEALDGLADKTVRSHVDLLRPVAAGVPVPGYAIDDQTAIKVTDGTVEVVSEGHWKLFTPNTERLSGFARANPSGRAASAEP